MKRVKETRQPIDASGIGQGWREASTRCGFRVSILGQTFTAGLNQETKIGGGVMQKKRREKVVGKIISAEFHCIIFYFHT